MNIKKVFQIVALAWICMLGLTACEPAVYGSVGVSSGWSNYGGSGMRGSVTVSGRVCC
jgi:hypothetical protein